MIKDATNMLATLLAAIVTGFVELRMIDRHVGARGSEYFPVSQPEQIAERAATLAAKCDVYFSAIPRVRESGTAADVGLAPAVWADVDSPEALAALDEFRLPPSIVVATGSADHVHAYWLLTEPVPAAEAVRLNRALASYLGADTAATDAARILRLPATLNHKADPPVQVKLVTLERERRYSPGDFAAVLPVSTPEADVAGESVSAEISDPVACVLAKLDGVRSEGAGWKGLCPAHDDFNPSLSISEGEDGRCLVHCFADCSTEDVVAALDLEMSDLFADGAPGRVSPATKLVDLAMQSGLELLHDEMQRSFGAVRCEDHRETMALSSPSFVNWLQYQYYLRWGSVPSSATMGDALNTLRGLAKFEGPELPVAVRVGGSAERIVLDLGDPGWRAVEITAEGWGVVAVPDVLFQRPATSLALPLPVSGGSLDDLRRFVNVADADWPLIKGWLVNAVYPTGPYPNLVLLGEQGTAKSTTAEFVRNLVDPVIAARRSLPRSERDLMISADNSWLVFLDNVTKLTPEQSNTLCRLSTGGGFTTRELYSDRGEVIFDISRAVIMTGIDIAGMGEDLRERSFICELPIIEATRRQQEQELRREYETLRPAILGGLLDAVACAIRHQSQTTLEQPPRMADAAIRMTAAEPALDLPPGTIAEAMRGNRDAAVAAILEGDATAKLIMGYITPGHDFWGIHGELLTKLRKDASKDDKAELPSNAQQLSVHLKKIAPALRSMGYVVSYPRRGNGGRRTVSIRHEQDA